MRYYMCSFTFIHYPKKKKKNPNSERNDVPTMNIIIHEQKISEKMRKRDELTVETHDQNHPTRYTRPMENCAI